MKRPGCCTLCEKPVREVKKYHTKGKMKGEPIEFGGWEDNAWRATYELSDGSLADLSFCEDCLGGDHVNIWAAVKERFIWEYENIKVDRTPLQKEAVEREINRILELSIKREVGRRMWKFSGPRFGDA